MAFPSIMRRDMERENWQYIVEKELTGVLDINWGREGRREIRMGSQVFGLHNSFAGMRKSDMGTG